MCPLSLALYLLAPPPPPSANETQCTSLTPRPPPPPPPPPPPRFARPRRAGANQGTPMRQWSGNLVTDSRTRRAGRAGLHLAHGGVVDRLEAREVEVARGLRGVLQLDHLRADLELRLNRRPARLLLLQGLRFARARWCVASGTAARRRTCSLQEKLVATSSRAATMASRSPIPYSCARARVSAHFSSRRWRGKGARRAAHHQ